MTFVVDMRTLDSLNSATAPFSINTSSKLLSYFINSGKKQVFFNSTQITVSNLFLVFSYCQATYIFLLCRNLWLFKFVPVIFSQFYYLRPSGFFRITCGLIILLKVFYGYINLCFCSNDCPADWSQVELQFTFHEVEFSCMSCKKKNPRICLLQILALIIEYCNQN